ncbi:MAG: DUF4160 domain-containing protein [Thiogranum sp.]
MHIYCGDGEAKFWLEPQVELARNYRLSKVRLREIEAIIEANYDELKATWSESSGPEVTNVSSHGLWLEIKSFFCHMRIPLVKRCPNRENPKYPGVDPGHFYWPDINVDLGIETIEHPDRFPLKAK